MTDVSFQVDLVGGYYDAGDNVKFGLPMAFTTTLLSWSVIEFGSSMPSQIGNARAAIRWSTDYLLKAATATPDTLYVQVTMQQTIIIISIMDSTEMKILREFLMMVCRWQIQTWTTSAGRGLKTWTHPAMSIRCLNKTRGQM